MGSACTRDRGDVMLWVVVALPALLTGILALVSASEYWEMRRDAAAVAAVSARAGAQGDMLALRAAGDGENSLEHLAAAERSRRRALAVIDATNDQIGPQYRADITVADGHVLVEVSADVNYTFFSVGMPRVVRGSARASALEGTTSGHRR